MLPFKQTVEDVAVAVPPTEELTVRVTVLVAAEHAPSGSFVVRVKVTIPAFPEIGVNVTDAGLAVCAMLLN